VNTVSMALLFAKYDELLSRELVTNGIYITQER
jgi:hypothetical protein